MGRRFIQSEAAAENLLLYSNDLSTTWVSTGYTSMLAAQGIAPNGKLEANSVLENSGTSVHRQRQQITPDGSSNYVASVYVKYVSKAQVHIQLATDGFVGTPSVVWDIQTGTFVSASGDEVSYGMEYCGNGWYRIWVVGASDASVLTWILIGHAEGGNVSYTGNGTSQTLWWGHQIEVGDYPSSPILTTSSAVTRAKDELRWTSTDAPSELYGKYSFQLIPYWDNTWTGGPRFMSYDPDGVNNRMDIYWLESVDKIRVFDPTGSTEYVVSNALTFSKNQVLTVTVDPTAGSITVSGATTGNGTVTGTPWTFPQDTVHVGNDINGNSQMNGLISEPYKIEW